VNQDVIEQKITVARQRLRALCDRSDASIELRAVLAEALDELSRALDELQTVAEELSRQNAELIATRAAAEADRQRHRELFEHAPDGYLVTDSVGVIDEANEAAAMLLNVPRRVLRGRPLGMFVTPAGRSEFYRQLAHLRTDERRQDWELRLCPRSAPARAVAVSVTAIGGQHRSPTLRWMLRDITERQELEARLRQAQKMEAIGRLAGGIAHDFNNLLTVIVGRGQMILDRLDWTHPLHGDVQLVQRAANRATTLVQQLLAFSRKQLIQPRVLDLNAVLAGMEPMLRRLISEDIELTGAPGPGVGQVLADQGQIEQMILNLVANAKDAMPRGGELTLETANVDLDDAFVRGHAGAGPART
jgi:PAS domain S-box-containing protein